MLKLLIIDEEDVVGSNELIWSQNIALPRPQLEAYILRKRIVELNIPIFGRASFYLSFESILRTTIFFVRSQMWSNLLKKLLALSGFKVQRLVTFSHAARAWSTNASQSTCSSRWGGQWLLKHITLWSNYTIYITKTQNKDHIKVPFFRRLDNLDPQMHCCHVNKGQ